MTINLSKSDIIELRGHGQAAVDAAGAIRAQIRALQEELKVAENVIKTAMEAAGDKKIIGKQYAVTYVEGRTEFRFDADAFDDAHPGLREGFYTKEINVKPSLRWS